MKKSFLLLSSLAIVTTLGFVLSSCKDDEKPAKAKVSFATATKTVQESAGTIDVKVTLDRPVSADLLVTYDLSGTAIQKAGLVQGDYEVVGDVGEVTILKGETSGTIQLKIIDDTNFESDETIVVTLSDVNGTDAVISTDDEIDVTIQSDDPGAVVSFTTTTPLTVVEGTGDVQVEVQLDIPSSEDITITYALTGTAIDSVKAKLDTSLDSDYAIQDETPGQIIIPKGETTGKITINMYSDLSLEDADNSTFALDAETIKITLNGTSGGGASINSSKDEFNINLKQEDGMIIELDWDYTTVDMDLGLWIGDDVASLDLIALSAYDNLDPDYPSSFEQLFLPKIFNNGVDFGLSYVYYAGDKEPMDFEVVFIDVIDGVIESNSNWMTTPGSYTLANIHQWANASDLTLVEQTFNVASGEFANFSALTVPASSSRSISGNPTTKNFHRTNTKQVNKYFKR